MNNLIVWLKSPSSLVPTFMTKSSWKRYIEERGKFWVKLELIRPVLIYNFMPSRLWFLRPTRNSLSILYDALFLIAWQNATTLDAIERLDNFKLILNDLLLLIISSLQYSLNFEFIWIHNIEIHAQLTDKFHLSIKSILEWISVTKCTGRGRTRI